MKVISEINLTSFEFWSGGLFNAQMLTYDELEQLEYIFEDIYSEGMTDTMINDIMWFDFGVVCEWLGLVYDEENDVIIR
jgi:hypothetical protein